MAVSVGMTYGTCDMTAESLGRVQVTTQKLHSSGNVPSSGFDESPNTIGVSASLHELEATAKAKDNPNQHLLRQRTL